MTEARARIGGVLMAAGAGRRMGGRPKSLLQRDDEPLLLRQLRLLRLAGVGPIAVVLGHHAQRLAQALAPCAAPWLSLAHNPEPDVGPGTSLRCGLAHLPPALDAIVVALADQALLEDGDTQAMLQAWWQRPPSIELLVPEHAGQPGHPLVFGPALRQAVLAMPAHEGVRQWRRRHPERVQTRVVQHARYTTDIDTPDDVHRLTQQSGIRLNWPQD